MTLTIGKVLEGQTFLTYAQNVNSLRERPPISGPVSIPGGGFLTRRGEIVYWPSTDAPKRYAALSDARANLVKDLIQAGCESSRILLALVTSQARSLATLIDNNEERVLKSTFTKLVNPHPTRSLLSSLTFGILG